MSSEVLRFAQKFFDPSLGAIRKLYFNQMQIPGFHTSLLNLKGQREAQEPALSTSVPGFFFFTVNKKVKLNI